MTITTAFFLAHHRHGVALRRLSCFRHGFEASMTRLQSSSSREENHGQTTESSFQRNYQQLQDASKLSLAPMMEYTDRHFRHLVRLISSRTLLYTEMVAANALAHERASRISEYNNDNYNNDISLAEINGSSAAAAARLHYNDQYMRRYLGQANLALPREGACVLQLGGSDPAQMHQAAQGILEMTERGHCDYTAVNINCGCPSPKVAGKGCFGAALMDDPALVAELAASLNDGCQGRLPITVKCRIGTDSDQPFSKLGYADIDEEAEYKKLVKFVDTVASKGIVTDFSVHARIAVLQKSFSPADNRKIPPLKYHYIQRLINDFPELTFSLNGGVESLSETQQLFDEMPGLTGVMIGRAWAADPWSFAMADKLLYKDENAKLPLNRRSILEAYAKHADAEEENGDPVKIRRFIVKAIMPLFTGEPRAKKYRVALDDIAGIPKKLHAQGKSLEGQPKLSELIMDAAMTHLSDDVLDRSPEESYERILIEEIKRNGLAQNDPTSPRLRSESVQEWQEQRKQEGPGLYEQTLASGDASTP